jgi:DNA-binding MarR family transcriptional regulator
MTRTPKPLPQLLLQNQICHSLYSASNALVRAYRPALEALDLTYPQYLVMMSLWEQDAVSIKQISEQTRLDAPTLTPILKRLEVKGLLKRERSLLDERQKVIAVTEAGWQLMEQAAHVPHAMVCLTRMDAADAATLKRLTERLYGQLTG